MSAMPAKKKTSASLQGRVEQLEARMEQMKAGLQQVVDIVQGLIEE